MSEALITIASRHSAHMERLKAHEVAKFDQFLKQLDRQLRERLSRIDLTAITRVRLEKQIAGIDALINGTMQDYRKVWRESVKELAVYEAGFEKRALEKVVDGVEFALPSDSQIRAAVFSAPLAGIKGPDGGKLLEGFYSGMSQRTRDRITGAVRSGFAQGQTTQQVIQAIRGTRAGGFNDGVLAISARDARAMAHTSLQHAAQQARDELWQNNSDIIGKWRFVATLDGKTSTQCRSLDSTQYPIGEGPKPPIHIGCRSTSVAVLKPPFDELSRGRTRSSRDPATGKVESVSAKKSYYQWLKDQPKGFQESIIGPTRTKLLNEGGLSAERFAELNLNKNFKPATLDEMRRMEPTAFDKAGLD